MSTKGLSNKMYNNNNNDSNNNSEKTDPLKMNHWYLCFYLSHVAHRTFNMKYKFLITVKYLQD